MAAARTPIEAAVALASLSTIGPRRFTAVVRAFGFVGAWERVGRRALLSTPEVAKVLGAKAGEVQDQWAREWRAIAPGELLDAHHRAGVAVTIFGDDCYPSALAADVEPPMVLFSLGELDAIRGRRVAIVGTRRCTRGGRLTALEMARGHAGEGVSVVSGLALGIDGAAHEGVLAATGGAPPIGVVGTGLDVVYPRRHHQLWETVAARGVLLSEVPIGGGALPWRFPARNRIIAALSEVVVVVESHATGGALHTVDEALRRDHTVLVVPGSVRSAASVGTNTLLHDGLGPARDARDVLVALGSGVGEASAAGSEDEPASTTPATPLPGLGQDRVDPADAAVLAHLGGEPVSIDHLAAATGLELGDLAVRLIRLEQQGAVSRSGSWIEGARR